MHPVRVGTCGWSYKEWSGVFYPNWPSRNCPSAVPGSRYAG
jgi:uncharacterized protein YecE (DUF72 family)